MPESSPQLESRRYSFMNYSLAPLKILFIAADAFWMLSAATPPNAPLPPEKQVIPDWRERYLKSLALPSRIFRTLYWTSWSLEVVVILASAQPNSSFATWILSHLLRNPHNASKIGFTWWFVLGHVLVWCGGAFRLQCYRTLGRHFTFELAIHPDHVLIDYGPYSIVRHPSYTGLIVLLFGSILNHVEGSWVRESGVLETPVGRLLAFGWMAILVAVILSLIFRVPNEDRLLRAKFGPEWRLWAKRVPYRLLPFIY
ncbi:hypothetical protein CC1G_01484 [Coprinopsis cinerea okayama7|uniref:Protein-S-isoprenylcysteine O-methyltransferase n=1 Tax=Coprinopsis cinerea (strain Okayama-7 / 130 / ATCC MYA-4618 / FGSC 9003) TaxID=240176 RepID=A8NHR0_COPC7|nr:hypothetical protein CC1G_01484 [Coprinopsis cinerea okayama7\|eukprot:XP_001833807.2 hypothetical protein CC1G_01484 [Coprinopsis cinerea okayama7\